MCDTQRKLSFRWPLLSLLLYAWVYIASLVHLCLSIETCIFLLQNCIVASHEGNNITLFSPINCYCVILLLSVFFLCIDIIDIEDVIKSI